MAEAVKRTSGRGKFISFEGGEGSGKSTQIKKLAERLDAAKLRAIVTREPGGSPGAEIIRHLLLSGMGKLNAMQRVTIGDLKPDLTIILDVPVEIGLQRAAARRGNGAPDRFEAEDIKFHQDLRDAYRQIAAEDPQRCVLIDANAGADAVAAQVWTALRDHLFAISNEASSA